MSILFVNGVNDRSQATLRLVENRHIRYVLDGNCNVMDYLGYGPKEAWSAILFGEDGGQPKLSLPGRPAVVFNQISDPDTHVGALRRCAELCAKLGVSVINEPNRVRATTRDQVSKSLQGIDGVLMPRSLRCRPDSPQGIFDAADAAGLEWPLIVREAGVHGGHDAIRTDGPEQLDLLHRFPFDGREFYLTEFFDCRGDDGLYRKWRLVMIDDEVHLRHALFAKDWIVNAACRDWMLEHESWEAFFQRMDEITCTVLPRLEGPLQSVRERIGLEYCGMDCCLLDDDRLLIFEVNANMNVLYNAYPPIQPLVDSIRDRIRAMVDRRVAAATA